MSADVNLNLGGNADFIRPKHNYLCLGFFYACMCCNSHKDDRNNRKDEANENQKFSRTEI